MLPHKRPEFADVDLVTSWIKSFRFVDGVVYSYWRIIWFVLAVWLILGLSTWWGLATSSLLDTLVAICTLELANSPKQTTNESQELTTYDQQLLIDTVTTTLPSLNLAN